MKKKYMSILLTAALAVGALTGCGANDSKQKDSDTKKADSNNDGEGKVINIYSWNDEFYKRVQFIQK